MKSEIRFISESKFCIEEKAGPCAMVIFGASGDLASRKLVPALCKLFQRGLLHDNFYILGCARTKMDDRQFRDELCSAMHGIECCGSEISSTSLIDRVYYLSGDYSDDETYKRLNFRMSELDRTHSTGGNHIFYMAIPPSVMKTAVEKLSSAKLVQDCGDEGPCARVVVEKPFGSNLKSANILDGKLKSFLNEDQIYRMDHYLGKETVQNILMFRFANSIFEPIWNKKFIDHVQITVAESMGVGHRAGYFEQAGLLRDVFQNHMFQMLILVGMDEPESLNADAIRDAKVGVLKTIKPFSIENVVRGQYGEGEINDDLVKGYRQEDGVSKDSKIETYVAAKLFVRNRRWKGVPFYLRAGKRLSRRVSEIAVAFKPMSRSIFKSFLPDDVLPNELVLNVQPEEGITLKIQAKHPGPKLCMGSLMLDFKYKEDLGIDLPDAYERLLLDCMLGDQTLFVRSDGMERSWKLIESILNKWDEDKGAVDLAIYEAGTWGPESANKLIEMDGRKWRTP